MTERKAGPLRQQIPCGIDKEKHDVDLVEWVCGEHAIKVNVTAVDDELLAGGVARLRGGEEEDHGGGDLGGRGHAVGEGDLRGDVGERGVGG